MGLILGPKLGVIRTTPASQNSASVFYDQHVNFNFWLLGMSKSGNGEMMSKMTK